MKDILNLVMVGVIIALGVIITVANSKPGFKDCEDKGGTGCQNCPFPCKHNR